MIAGENFYLAPVRSVDALVVAMQEFIDDPGLAYRTGRRSHEIAEEKYDAHKVNTVIVEALGLLPGQGEEAGQDG